MPVAGGEETRVIEKGGRSLFAVAEPGIWFLDVDAGGAITLKNFDETSGRVEKFREFPSGTRMVMSSTTMSVSPDGFCTYKMIRSAAIWCCSTRSADRLRIVDSRVSL
jgi:hypothetical protein